MLLTFLHPYKTNRVYDIFLCLGYDTWHNSSQKGQSVGGLVCSTNQTLTRFYSQCTLHYNNEELCDNMKAGVMKAVQVYVFSNIYYDRSDKSD